MSGPGEGGFNFAMLVSSGQIGGAAHGAGMHGVAGGGGGPQGDGVEAFLKGIQQVWKGISSFAMKGLGSIHMAATGSESIVNFDQSPIFHGMQRVSSFGEISAGANISPPGIRSEVNLSNSKQAGASQGH